MNGAQLGAGVKQGLASAHKAGAAHRLKATIIGVTATIECNKNVDAGEIIGGVPGTDTVSSDTFSECTARAGSTTCTVESLPGKVAKDITLKPLKSTLVWKGAAGEAARDLLKPASGTVFAEFELKGSFPCPGKVEVTGEVLAEVSPVGQEVAEGELVFPGALIKEYFTGDPANRVKHGLTTPLHVKAFGITVEAEEFAETETIKLNSGMNFGVFPENKVL